MPSIIVSAFPASSGKESYSPTEIVSQSPSISDSIRPSTTMEGNDDHKEPTCFQIRDPSVSPDEIYASDVYPSKSPNRNESNTPSIIESDIGYNNVFPSLSPSRLVIPETFSDSTIIGISAGGIGVAVFALFLTFKCRCRGGDDTIVETIELDASASSSTFSSSDNSNRNSRTNNVGQVSVYPSQNDISETVENDEKRQNTFSSFSYSEDSSDMFRDVGLSLTSSSMGSCKDSTRFSIDDLEKIPKHQQQQLPVQKLNRPLLNENTIYSGSSSQSQSQVSILETEVLQPQHNNVARLLSCFTSTYALQHLPSTGRLQSMKTKKMQSESFVDELKSDAISIVSSLSGKSSCSVTTIDLHQGEPYEVLVTGRAPLGLVVTSARWGPQIVHVKEESPLYRVVEEGDYILKFDGFDTREATAKELSKWLHNTGMTEERTIVLLGRKVSFMNSGKRSI